MSERCYVFPPGVVLRIVSRRSHVLAYFDAEYGPFRTASTADVQLTVHVGKRSNMAHSPGAVVHRRRRKLTNWTITFTDLESERTCIEFDGHGVMTLPYLQSFYIEPLLRFKLLLRDHALVHGASVCKGSKSRVFVGGSRVGKTSLTLSQADRGNAVQGDNYVILSPDGTSVAFPRRLRVYPDLRRSLPAIHRRLPLTTRARLKSYVILTRLSRGYANPAIRLPLAQLVPDCKVMPEAVVESVFVLRPHTGKDLVGPTPISLDQTVTEIQSHASMEAVWLTKAIAPYVSDHPESSLNSARVAEASILNRALSRVSTYEILVPRVDNVGDLVRDMSRIAGLA